MESANNNSTKQKPIISEEEARQLLAEDKARLEKGWEKAEKRRKRIAVMAAAIAVVVCVIGLVMVLVMKNK